MKALFVIVNYDLKDKLDEEISSLNLPINVITHGYGSASSEILDYLGIGETKKLIAISILPDNSVKDVVKVLGTKLKLNKAGHGIAFSCNISSVSGFISKTCSDIFIEDKGESIMDSLGYELIVTVVTKGYFSQVMDAAKAVGAKGGTLIHARGLGTEEAERFLGITISPEKDFVMILASHDKKQAIMEAIIKETGINTKGKGICFTLPVSDTYGLSSI